MTNKSARNADGCVASSGPGPKRQMRTLDIEFATPVDTFNSLNNGFRPHGGYRGTNKYPISQYTYNKEYKKQLKEKDLAHLIGADSFEFVATPGYAVNTSRTVTHSGESPLFENRLLAPSRLEQQFSPEDYAHNIARNKKSKRPSSGAQYYRPESPHQYLQASGRASWGNLVNGDSAECKLGRPTRTTLLRARQQRCTSAPVNMYKMRQEIKKQYEQKQESQKSTTAPLTVKDLLGVGLPAGESIHSFLIGARYNSAHCLDSKSITTHGVYMPRGNPLGCFVVKERQKEGSDGVPATPPDSPASNSDNEDDGPPPSPVNREAWTNEEPHHMERRKPAKCTNIPIMQQIMNKDDGLNITGTGVNDTKPSSKFRHHQQQKPAKTSRPSSARVPTGGGNQLLSAKAGRGSGPHSARINSSRCSANKGPGPFVLIQGTSYPRKTKTPADYREHYPVSPPPSPVATGGNISGRKNNINNISNSRPNSSRQRHLVNGVDGHHTYKIGSEPVVKVNVPSVTSVDVLEVETPPLQQSPRQNSDEEPEVVLVEKMKDKEPDLDTVLTNEDLELQEKENNTPVEIEHEVVNEEVVENSSESKEQEIDVQEPESKENESLQEKPESESEGSDDMEQTRKRLAKVRFSDEVTELATPRVEDNENGDEAKEDTNVEQQMGQGDSAIFFITEDGADPNAKECEIKIVKDGDEGESFVSENTIENDIDVNNVSHGKQVGENEGSEKVLHESTDFSNSVELDASTDVENAEVNVESKAD